MHRNLLRRIALFALLPAAAALAGPISGTVTNKTTGKPSAGDTVVLVEMQAGLSEVAHATTDARGHFTLSAPAGGGFDEMDDDIPF